MQQNFYKIANATKIVFYSILSQTSQDMWLVSDCRDRSVGTVMGGGGDCPSHPKSEEHILYHATHFAVVKLRGPEGAWPPERPGSPHKTSGLRGYKGACKRPHEITHQSMIEMYHSKHRCWCFLLPEM